MKQHGTNKIAALGCVLFAVLFLSSCAKEAPSAPQFVPLAALVPLEASVPLLPPEIIVPEEELPEDLTVLSQGIWEEDHVHAFHLVSSRMATCSQEGACLYTCECGREVGGALKKTAHDPGEASCTENAVCRACGAVIKEALGHTFPRCSDRCSRCGYTLTRSFYVLGKELEFDESASSVREKLGAPTAVVNEGSLFTYVYARDLKRLTFIQMDEGGVWGVFSFDPALRMRRENSAFGLSDFAGVSLPGISDACLVFGDAAAYAFLDGNTPYALWMRLDEYEYNFASDPSVFRDFAGQETLSLYFTNAQRARAGRRSLIRSSEADAVAREYCDELIRTDRFEHDYSFEWRLREKGVPWKFAGENLSLGYVNCFFVCDAYLNSPEHRENLLSADYTHLGLSYRKAGGTVYGAQEFFST